MACRNHIEQYMRGAATALRWYGFGHALVAASREDHTCVRKRAHMLVSASWVCAMTVFVLDLTYISGSGSELFVQDTALSKRVDEWQAIPVGLFPPLLINCAD